MLTPLPFALHASAPCVPHAELALSLAAAFHTVDAEAVDGRIEALAEGLAVDAHASPRDQLDALAELAHDPRAPQVSVGGDVCCLMLDDALADAVAHPLVGAIVLAEVGRRRGLDVGIVSNGRHHCLGHEQLGEPLLLRADTGAVVDGRALPETLQWCCAHETAAMLLDELEERFLTWTRIDEALRAAELRLRLPLDEESEQGARIRVHAVRSRLN
ncbi:MAG: hypothetical protein GXY03_15465 [Solirubrobacterales bacterium]|nr:hypothetical protein [Solirubrobacterales bacterium]